MKIKVPYYYIFSEYILLGSVLCHTISNSLWSMPMEEMVRKQTLKCNNFCPYGFKTDVEGMFTCSCLDPCRSLRCLQGTKCVVVMPKNCEWELCSPTPTCQEEKIVHVQPKNGDTPYWKGLSQLVQGDDPHLWTGIDVCAQPLPDAAVTCKRKRRRWYYSPMTGQCVRFLGCDTPGNNFARKYSCKSKCRTNILTEEQRKHLENNTQVCHESFPEKGKNCNLKRRRWFYNTKTGKCEKVMGCKSEGNNFSRKLFCKTKCKSKRVQFKGIKTVSDKRVRPVR